MKITTIGLDLAKALFQVHGVDGCGKVAARKQLKRAEMSKYFANLEPCLIGMEACGSSHYWARKLEGYGHTVKLMAPQFVKPYVKTNKNDMADAEAICEAVGRPNMRFVAIKTIEQQAILSVHRARQGRFRAWVRSRQVRLWQRWAMHENSRMVVNWQHGWGSYLGNTPVAESRICWVSASVVILTCAP